MGIKISDDGQFEIISKMEIIRKLKSNSKSLHASLPRDIEFSIKNRILSVFINNATQNMQVSSAAFEGWIIVLKSWLSDEIEYVVLDFKVPENLSGQYGAKRVKPEPPARSSRATGARKKSHLTH